MDEAWVCSVYTGLLGSLVHGLEGPHGGLSCFVVQLAQQPLGQEDLWADRLQAHQLHLGTIIIKRPELLAFYWVLLVWPRAPRDLTPASMQRTLERRLSVSWRKPSAA